MDDHTTVLMALAALACFLSNGVYAQSVCAPCPTVVGAEGQLCAVGAGIMKPTRGFDSACSLDRHNCLNPGDQYIFKHQGQCPLQVINKLTISPIPTPWNVQSVRTQYVPIQQSQAWPGSAYYFPAQQAQSVRPAQQFAQVQSVPLLKQPALAVLPSTTNYHPFFNLAVAPTSWVQPVSPPPVLLQPTITAYQPTIQFHPVAWSLVPLPVAVPLPPKPITTTATALKPATPTVATPAATTPATPPTATPPTVATPAATTPKPATPTVATPTATPPTVATPATTPPAINAKQAAILNCGGWQCSQKKVGVAIQNCTLAVAPTGGATSSTAHDGGWLMPVFCDDELNTLAQSMAAAAVPDPIPTGYILINGVGYYKFHTESMTWSDADAACKADGVNTHLAVPNVPSDYKDLLNFVKTKNSYSGIYWVGYTDAASAKQGDFVASTGQPACHLQNLVFHRIEKSGPADRCLLQGRDIISAGMCTDPCSTSLPFLCEQTLPSKAATCVP